MGWVRDVVIALCLNKPNKPMCCSQYGKNPIFQHYLFLKYTYLIHWEPKGWLDGLFAQGNKELDDTKSDNWGLSGLIWSKDNNPEVEGWIGLYYYKGKRLTCDEIVARIAKDDAKSCITTDDRQKICDLAKFVQNSNLKQSRDQIMKTFGVLSAEEILSKKWFFDIPCLK